MGWLIDYLKYNERQESPERFHFWCGITTIASVLNRKVWLPRVSDGIERYRIYPGQIMTILVAGSGLMRKSTALKLPKNLISRLGIRAIEGKVTPERLLTLMGANTNGAKKGIVTILASELAVFFSKQQYAEPLIDIFTHLADAPDNFNYCTQKGGDINVRDVCVTFLGASTPSSLGEALPAQAGAHGFRSRFIFVYEQTTNRKESLAETRVDAARLAEAKRLETNLATGLQQMLTWSGPVDFDDQGRDWYHDWYHNIYTKSADSDEEGWAGRRHDHMLRVALCLNASEAGLKNGKIEITEGDLIAADAALKEVEAGHQKAFEQIGRHISSRGMDRILGSIRHHGFRVPVLVLRRECIMYYPSGRELAMALKDMQQTGMIDVIDHGKPTEAWFLVGSPGDPRIRVRP